MTSVTRVKVEHSRELLNLVLAAVLFVSPWVLGFAGETAAAWTAWGTGVVVAIFAAIALFVESVRAVDTASLVLGIWTIVAPWIVGFAAVTLAWWTCLAVGVLLVLVAAWEVLTDTPRKAVAT